MSGIIMMRQAELNIIYPKYANDDPRFADVMDNLARIDSYTYRSDKDGAVLEAAE